MIEKPLRVAIVGAGLVGSMLAIYLSRRGYKVTVFEHRPDLRAHFADSGRSINLALSNRGLRALEEVGVAELVRKYAIPMNGRQMHDLQGNLTFLPYGRQGQFINSISRSGLNRILVDKAAKAGVDFLFEHRCVNADLEKNRLTFQFRETTRSHETDFIIGSDGAYSEIRSEGNFDYTQQYIEHGYKELHIPAEPPGSYRMEKKALHIWPRERFMLIALPNPDASFTCTLFLPLEGTPSFSQLTTPEAIESFFRKFFPDVYPMIASLASDFMKNPTSTLVTIRCFPWLKNDTLLIGDAAHAIVPFFGQGMNAGFEDCRLFNGLLERTGDRWDLAVPEFQEVRKPDTDAIAELALENFVEMRDLVADADFLLRKKIEAKLHELYPEKWIPLYSMVTFHDDLRYSEAQAIGRKQKEIMDKVMATPGIRLGWNSLNFDSIANELS